MGGILSQSLVERKPSSSEAYIRNVRSHLRGKRFRGKFLEIIQVIQEYRVCHPRSRGESNWFKSARKSPQHCAGNITLDGFDKPVHI